MYENLMCLPYFQGMSKDDITSILDKVKLEFHRYIDGEQIAGQGMPCNNLTLLVRGTLTATCTSPDGSYTLIEEIMPPFAFEPYSLFGLSPKYSHSYSAKGGCDILTIDKSYLFNEFARYDIFQMNLLNLLCQRAQQKSAHIWRQRPMELSDKIIEFIATRAETQEGCKTLQIKMEDMAAILGETRINVSRVLNAFRRERLIELRRREILIPSFRKLLETQNRGEKTD